MNCHVPIKLLLIFYSQLLQTNRFSNFRNNLLLTVFGVFGPMFCLSDSRVMIPIINLFGFKVSYCILLVLQIIVVVAIAGAGRDDELFSL